ncbi:MAG TPA: hypothetical protein VK464_00865 [Symbiobacteriaceae bacterium]|jgi:hypothetical protein|nr:hypothetical protein [Symbiobacteriaceae bacterium]
MTTWQEQGPGGQGSGQYNLTLTRGDRQPLALEIWDPALDSPVQNLTASAARGSEGPVAAVPSRPGVYLFPGLRSLGRLPPGEQAEIRVQLRDSYRRFAPASLALTVWYEENGALQMRDRHGGQQLSPRPAQLYSDPNRSPGAILAVVRGDLWDQQANQPAAYGLVQVQIGDQTWTSAADGRGAFLVALPLPPRLPSLDSDGAQGPPTVAATVAVLYQPGSVSLDPGGLPELTDLAAQAPGVIYPAAGSTPVSQISVQLPYTAELVVRSENSSWFLIG